MENKVSIIVPVYHVEKYLYKCIDSIRNQSYYNIEIILVDDGGDDECPRICDDYARLDARIKCIHKENEGQSYARRDGVAMATGDFMMFVDADDWILPETIEHCMAKAIEYNADIVSFNYKRYYENHIFDTAVFEENRLWKDEELFYLKRRIIGLLDSEMQQVQNADRTTSMWGKLYRREVIEAGKFISEREIGSMEDGIFNLYALNKCRTYYHLNEFLYCYRKTNDNATTKKYRKDLFEQWNRLYDYLEAYIDESDHESELQEALRNRIVISILGLGWNVLSAPDGYLKKMSLLRAYLNHPRWRNAYKQLKLNNLGLKWKFFFGIAKYKYTWLLLIMLIVTEKMRRVKAN